MRRRSAGGPTPATTQAERRRSPDKQDPVRCATVVQAVLLSTEMRSRGGEAFTVRAGEWLLLRSRAHQHRAQLCATGPSDGSSCLDRASLSDRMQTTTRETQWQQQQQRRGTKTDLRAIGPLCVCSFSFSFAFALSFGSQASGQRHRLAQWHTRPATCASW